MHDADVRRHRLEVSGAVSSRDSPLLRLELLAEKLRASADSRFSAMSKEERVRVEGLDEQVDDRPPAQGRDLFDRSGGDLLERAGHREDVLDLVGLEVGNPQQVLVSERRILSCHDLRMTTSSLPSSSESRTLTFCRGLVRTTLPTWSA